MDHLTDLPFALVPGVPLVESPFFDEWTRRCALDDETLSIARQLHEFGYAIIDFPDPEILEIAARIRARYPIGDWSSEWRSHRDQSLRMIDGWLYDQDIRRIAVNPRIIEILSNLYGRPAFPFQTLTFPIGTQQKPHSDSVHFSSQPERFMCAVWVALEDMDSENGTLVYYPGSHNWPILGNPQIGCDAADPEDTYAHYAHFERAWEAVAKSHHVQLQRLHAKAGQALIWTANLLHGGDIQHDKSRTRYSQATHYFFEGCAYYTPLMSHPISGTTYFREPINIVTGRRVQNTVGGREVSRQYIELVSPPHRRASAGTSARAPTVLPADFDSAAYLRLNPDIARAGADAAAHYLEFGWKENRKWR